MQNERNDSEHKQQVDKPARDMKNCKATDPSYQ
jgi:hypothetical protein